VVVAIDSMFRVGTTVIVFFFDGFLADIALGKTMNLWLHWKQPKKLLLFRLLKDIYRISP